MKLAECTNEHLIHGQIYFWHIRDLIYDQIYWHIDLKINTEINDKSFDLIYDQIYWHIYDQIRDKIDGVMNETS